LNRIDPNGLTDYNVTADGHIYKTNPILDAVRKIFGINDKNDKLIAVGNKNKTLEITEGSIGKINNLEGDKGQYFNVSNEKDAGKVHEFLSENTGVEWGRTEANKSKEQVNFLSTSHDATAESVAPMITNSLLGDSWNVTQVSHSHLTGAGPSGYHSWDKNDDYSDRKVVNYMNTFHPNNAIVNRVFDVRHGRYIYFNNTQIYRYEK